MAVLGNSELIMYTHTRHTIPKLKPQMYITLLR